MWIQFAACPVRSDAGNLALGPFSFCSTIFPFHETVCNALDRPEQHAGAQLTMSQVDPGTLAELPDDVRREVLRSLVSARGGAGGSAPLAHGGLHRVLPARPHGALAGKGRIATAHAAGQRQQLQQRQQGQQNAASRWRRAAAGDGGAALRLVEAIVEPRLELGWPPGGGSSSGGGHPSEAGASVQGGLLMRSWADGLVTEHGTSFNSLLAACVEQLLLAAGNGGDNSEGSFSGSGSADSSGGDSTVVRHAPALLLQEQLRRLAATAVRHARDSVEHNLEEVAGTLHTLRRLATKWHDFSAVAAGAERKVQLLVERRYGGPLMLPRQC